MFENLSSKQLVRAAQLKERIESLEAELAEIIGGGTGSGSSASSGTSSGSSSPARGGKGLISAAGLAKIRAAQKARWAKFRKEKGMNGAANGTSASGSKPKRTMSPAAKAKIRAAAKDRWAKAKAAGRTTL